jgi:hypothetical protein
MRYKLIGKSGLRVSEPTNWASRMIFWPRNFLAQDSVRQILFRETHMQML